jgi:hypothetical protein
MSINSIGQERQFCRTPGRKDARAQDRGQSRREPSSDQRLRSKYTLRIQNPETKEAHQNSQHAILRQTDTLDVRVKSTRSAILLRMISTTENPRHFSCSHAPARSKTPLLLLGYYKHLINARLKCTTSSILRQTISRQEKP